MKGMMKKWLGAGAVALALSCVSVQGAGFAIIEQSTPGLGRGLAGMAADVKEAGETQAEIITEDSYKELLQTGKKVYFAGDGSAKCSGVITSENAVFVDSIEPDAANMAELAERRLRNGEFVDVAYFEPFYLKDFVATQSKHKVL